MPDVLVVINEIKELLDVRHVLYRIETGGVNVVVALKAPPDGLLYKLLRKVSLRHGVGVQINVDPDIK